ncbi:hypothetical protein JB92DRAFT_2893671 [Gautieria morchelliformis]|nr:hypothetical protein JB92DRAFT_2893671 [Gautieria morchelliformis]
MPSSHQSPKSSINSYVQALEVHLSNLDARLAAALDTLDEIRQNHDMELQTLHSQANSLKARCQIFQARAEEAEAERDGLKRDVNKLVEKVEIANDHLVLPCSRIYLPHPLETAWSRPIRPEEDIPRDAYLRAILDSLNAELTAEKHAFSELQRVSEARIATLEAQAARRDAEAAAYKPCSCRHSATSEMSLAGSHKPQLPPAGTLLSEDQAHKAFKDMAIRQRILEHDIDGLRRKLRSSQSAILRPKSRHPLPRPSPPSPDDTNVTPGDPLTRPAIQREHPDPGTHPVLADIDGQLARIGRAFSNLQAERDNVHAEVDADSKDDSRHADGQEDEKFRGVLLIEEECIRLRKSERALRQEILIATAAASATEQSLKSLINRLQRQVHKLVNDPTGVDDANRLNSKFQRHRVSGDPSYGGDTQSQEEEVSSEHPITTSVRGPPLTPPLHTPTLSAQPHMVPPLSRATKNDHHSYQPPPCGRPPSAPPFLEGNHTQVQRHSTARLAQVEAELNQARVVVKEKDQAIRTLRAQLAALRTSVPVKTQRQSGGGPWRQSDGT